MSLNEIVQTMKDAVNRQADQAKPGGYDTTATVRRIEGGTAWVHIPGGVDETPVKMTINAKEGDDVQVRVTGGRAFLVGNGSAPPTDDARANQAYTVATVAEGAAENALANAARAAEAADSAQASATRAESAAGDAVIAAGDAQTAAGNAQTAADTALVNLATTEDVVGVLNWITAHGTMTNTQDLVPPETVIDPSHVYFVQDDVTPGDYHVGAHYYAIVSEPKQADIASYYLLSVDESVQNYVATHLAVDTEGLWIIPDSGGNKVLIATGAGSTYTTAGTYIVGKVGGVDAVLASFTASGAQVGQSSEGNTFVDSSGVYVKQNGATLSSFTSNGAQIGQSNGGNVVIDNNSVDINDGATTLATFGASGAQIGQDDADHMTIDTNGMTLSEGGGYTTITAKNYIPTTAQSTKDIIINKQNAVGTGTYSHELRYEYISGMVATFAFADPSGNSVMNDCIKQLSISSFGNWSINSQIGFTAGGTISYDASNNTITLAVNSMSGVSSYRLINFDVTYNSFPRYPSIGIDDTADLSNTDIALAIGHPSENENSFSVKRTGETTINGTSDDYGVSALTISNDWSGDVFNVDWRGNVEAAGDMTNTKSSGEVWHTAERSDTGVSVSLGIGSGGYNRGVYNNTSTNWIIFQDANGVTYIPSTSIRLKGHSNNIGYVKKAYLASATSVSSGGSNAKSLCQISLEAGTWFVVYGARFPSNSTGYRGVNFSTTKNDQSAMQIVAAVNGGVTQTRASIIVTPSSTTTFYLTALHTAGTALSMPASGNDYGSFITATYLM